MHHTVEHVRVKWESHLTRYRLRPVLHSGNLTNAIDALENPSWLNLVFKSAGDLVRASFRLSGSGSAAVRIWLPALICRVR